MKTVMIVDDEVLVRVGLQSLVDWDKEGYRLIGCYRDGMEAWEGVKKEVPDILLTDIRMPVLDGLSLIQRIRDNDIPMRIVILSSHEDFEYLRASIRLGVQDYIPKLKLEAEELLRVLRSLDVRERRETIDASLGIEKQKLLEATMPINGMISRQAIFSADRFPQLSKHVLKEEQSYRWMAIKPMDPFESDTEMAIRALYAQFSELTLRTNNVVMIGTDQGIVHWLVLRSSDEDAIEIGNEWIERIKINLNRKVAIGISDERNELNQLAIARRNAEAVLVHSFYKGDGVFTYGDWPMLERRTEEEWNRQLRCAEPMLRKHDFDSFTQWLQQEIHVSVDQYEPLDTIRFCRAALCLLNDYLRLHYPAADGEAEKDGVNPFCDSAGIDDGIATSKSLTSLCMEIVSDRVKRSNRMYKRSPWVAETIDYINMHYMKPLRLEDMASMANFSVNYFSQLFQRETGYAYTDFLSRIRINKAIELLRATSLSTDEVACQVGYINPNYFVKVFKRVTGKTITAYKQGMRLEQRPIGREGFDCTGSRN